MGGFFGSTMALLEQTLNLRSFRHEILSSNIANIETPGYRAREINFATELKKVGGNGASTGLTGTHPAHIGMKTGNSVNPEISFITTEAEALDGNSVGIDAQMVKLSENTMMYSISSKLITAKFRGLMTAIKA